MGATARKPAARAKAAPAVKANRKRGGHKKRHHHRRNTAVAAAKPRTASNPQTKIVYRTKPATKVNRRRHHKRRRNGSTSIISRMNPFGGKGIGGLQPMDLVGGAVGLLLDGAIQLVVPAGWVGLGIRGAGAIVMGKFLPRSIGPAAGLAAGAVVTKDGINRLFNISALLNSTVVRFAPTQLLAATPAQGMSGFGRQGMNPMGINFGRRISSGLKY